MRWIYQNAAFTIMAVGPRGVDEGFLKRRTFKGTLTCSLPFIYPVGSGRCLLLGRITASSDVPASFLEGTFKEPATLRAWTLQEDLLSQRRLYFGTMSTTFACVEAKWQDGGPMNSTVEPLLKLNMHLLTNPSDPGAQDTNWRHWHSLVEEYTQRNLTVPEDRSIAIAAIAEDFYLLALRPSISVKELFPQPYLAGLWLYNLPFDLLWHIKARGSPPLRPHPHRAPSWSWMSVDGPVTFDLDFSRYAQKKRLRTCIQNVEASVAQDHGWWFGDARDGKIVLQGRLEPALWDKQRTILIDAHAAAPSLLTGQKDKASLTLSAFERLDLITSKSVPDALDASSLSPQHLLKLRLKLRPQSELQGIPVWCLQILHDPGEGRATGYKYHWGLILEKVGGDEKAKRDSVKDGDRRVFRRMGIFRIETRCEPIGELDKVRCGWFTSDDMQTITIV
jgi:hypothetical protein